MTEPGNLCGSGHTVPNPCLALVPCDWLLFKPGYIAISPSLTSVALNYYVHDFWLQGYLIAKIKITSYSIMDNSVMFIHTHLYSWVYMRQTYDNHVCQCVVSVCVCFLHLDFCVWPEQKDGPWRKSCCSNVSWVCQQELSLDS